MILRSIFAGGSPVDILKNILFGVVAVIFAFTIHEFAHAFIAYKMGDKSQKYAGRMTLNPIKHVDPFGIVLLLLFGFGWAKPVMVNPRSYKYPKFGSIFVALAGVLANFISGFLWLFVYGFVAIASYDSTAALYPNLLMLLSYIFYYNIALGFFNLIPLPPLDGSKAVAEFLPFKYKYKYLSLERYSMFIFIGLILLLNQFNFIAVLTDYLLGFYLTLITPILGMFF